MEADGAGVARGRLRGKQPKLTRRQEAHVAELHATAQNSVAELAELVKVGRSTIYRAIERTQARQQAAAGDPPGERPTS